MITDDVTAWHTYPQHHKWFDKLWLSERLGYNCGPGGVPVPYAAKYIVRPIYNLRGMGLYAELQHLTPEDLHSVPPGYFWCEQFKGTQYSVDYLWNNRWQQLNAVQGHNQEHELYRFSAWTYCDYQAALPEYFNELKDCEYINVEFIDTRIIEVHLRTSPDPKGYTELITVWADETISQPSGYTWIPSPDDADGRLPATRLGFYAK